MNVIYIMQYFTVVTLYYSVRYNNTDSWEHYHLFEHAKVTKSAFLTHCTIQTKVNKICPSQQGKKIMSGYSSKYYEAGKPTWDSRACVSYSITKAVNYQYDWNNV